MAARKTPAKAKASTRKPATKAAEVKAAKRTRGGAQRGGSTKATVAKRKAKASKRATALVKRAKKAGATGPHGTDAQRALRDSAVCARLIAGDPSKDVAKEFGIAERTVRAIFEKRQKAPSPMDEAPMAILEGLAKDFRTQIADFEAMAWRHADVNPNVAVAAMKGALVARERYVELLNVVGKLPDNLELFRAESVLRRIAEEMVETISKLEAGEITVQAAGEFFRDIVAGSESAQRQQALPAAA